MGRSCARRRDFARVTVTLKDSFGRGIEYLRISVTDRCNFRCLYCMPLEGLEWLPKSDILSYEEIARVVMQLAPLGLRLPVYPVKGYSITVPIVDPSGAPESTVMDETHKVAITRLGDRIRVGGTAELAGYDLRLHEARRRTLEHVVSDLYPRGGDLGRATFWCGLRPMTPDGTPLVGPTPYANLYLATGHGTLGWTMAAGTARVTADIIGGRTPQIDLTGLTLERYSTSGG